MFPYLHPAVSSVHVLMADLQLVPTLRNKALHFFEELFVIRCTETTDRHAFLSVIPCKL